MSFQVSSFVQERIVDNMDCFSELELQEDGSVVFSWDIDNSYPAVGTLIDTRQYGEIGVFRLSAEGVLATEDNFEQFSE